MQAQQDVHSLHNDNFALCFAQMQKDYKKLSKEFISKKKRKRKRKRKKHIIIPVLILMMAVTPTRIVGTAIIAFCLIHPK